MSDNYTVLDGNGDPLTKKSSDLSGAHADAVVVTSSALPTGAATAAIQTTQQTEITSVKTAVQSVDVQIKRLNGHTQGNNFGGGLASFSRAANGGAVAATAAPTSGKKWLIEHFVFFELNTGAGTGDGKLAAGDRLSVALSEETTGLVLNRWTIKIAEVGDLENRKIEWSPPRPIKLTTADKKVMLTLTVVDSSSVAKARNLVGQAVLWLDEEV